MDTVKIDRFGRVLIPKKIRERLGIEAGQELELSVEGHKVTLEPQEGVGLVRKGHALVFDVRGGEDISDAVERDRAERMKRILLGSDYPDD